MAPYALNIMPNEFQKGGTNREPTFRIENTGPCTAILHADNAAGQVAAKMGIEHAIEIAKKWRRGCRH
ncbi:ureidoglycolate dehydrogenase [Salmonella enterica subsp. enterica serovar Choleraesuis str. 0006]|nr:ureidoglycolate dehydrogenase [Salmonella enterica subsp. enterica serovar Choleraesuis str. 0006]